MEQPQDEASAAGGQSRSNVGLEHNGWRPEVVAFADAMEARLRANDHKGGWQQCSVDWLLARLIQEAGELAEEVVAEIAEQGVLYEAADVANFAMMIADRAGELMCSNAGINGPMPQAKGQR